VLNQNLAGRLEALSGGGFPENEPIHAGGAMKRSIGFVVGILIPGLITMAGGISNPALAQSFEEGRAQQTNRVPGAIFLRQARFALVLRRLLRDKKVSHVHATSSRSLVCAIILKKLLDVTVSVRIEPRPELPRTWIEEALLECVGGRLARRKLLDAQNGSFVLDKTNGFHLTGSAKFWQQWSQLLLRWSCGDRKSKIENRK